MHNVGFILREEYEMKDEKELLLVSESMLQDGIGSCAALIYGYLYKHSVDGKFTLRQKDIMNFFQLSRTTVYRQLRILKEFNYIKYDENKECIYCLQKIED